MNQTIIIGERFRGPPNSGNGGYVCGLVARFIDGPAEVTLRHPPPLEQPLAVVKMLDSRIVVSDGDEIIAEARHVDIELSVPKPPNLYESLQASQRYPGFDQHDYPTCFVCGPSRTKKDGLCIFPGMVRGTDIVASLWKPDETLADDSGYVRPEYMWAALDCPGFFAVWRPDAPSMLLGRLSAEIKSQVQVGENMIVIGWPIGKDGRKYLAGTAIFSASGELYAFAKAIWIEVKEPPSAL